MHADARKLRDFRCLRVTISKQICLCKLSLWTMAASRKRACLVGKAQASDFLFSTGKLGHISNWFLLTRFLFRGYVVYRFSLRNSRFFTPTPLLDCNAAQLDSLVSWPRCRDRWGRRCMMARRCRSIVGTLLTARLPYREVSAPTTSIILSHENLCRVPWMRERPDVGLVILRVPRQNQVARHC